jgi:NAD(P)-dependent dehydrogenase (short-subunit alcohol dehydrogenase family)
MNIPDDLHNVHVVITGATSGIGFFAAQALAKQGALVIGVGRSEEHIELAKQRILAGNPQARLQFFLADLSSQKQVRDLAENITHYLDKPGENKLRALINNAGAVSNWFTATEDGYELQFAVNHLAPFLMTHELLPLLRQTPESRVITVSSNSHRNMRMYWKDVMFRKGYNTLVAYKQSKLANVLFTYEFNRREAKISSLKAYAADPGLVNTDIGLKGTHGLVRWIWQRRSKHGASPEKIGLEVAILAVAPEVNTNLSAYWKHCRPVQPSRYAQREIEAARLWELSERLCGINNTTGESDILGSGILVGGA